MDNNDIVFIGRGPGEEDESVYRMSANRRNLKRLIRNAFPVCQRAIRCTRLAFL